MNIRYEIDSENTIRIFAENVASPFLEQPFDPETKQKFDSYDDALAWAESFVLQYYENNES